MNKNVNLIFDLSFLQRFSIGWGSFLFLNATTSNGIAAKDLIDHGRSGKIRLLFKHGDQGMTKSHLQDLAAAYYSEKCAVH